MQEICITKSNLLQVLLDPHLRRGLHLALAHSGPEGSNQYWTACNECDASKHDLRDIFATVLAGEERDHDLLEPLVFHRNMPEDLLLDLCDQEKFISQLGHRRSPRSLLEQMAERHNYDEAITTLALCFYKDDPLETFVRFVEKYKNCWMLQFNLAYKCADFDAEKASFIRQVCASQFDRIFERQDLLRFLREAPGPEIFRICLKGDSVVQRELLDVDDLPVDILEALASHGKTKAIRNMSGEILKLSTKPPTS